MQALWGAADDWLIIREIRDRMNYPPVAYTTVATVTQILYGKGLLRRHLADRPGHPGPPAWRYRAARPASEHIGELIATLLDHSPSPAETLAYALSITRTGSQPDTTIHPPTIDRELAAAAATIAHMPEAKVRERLEQLQARQPQARRRGRRPRQRRSAVPRPDSMIGRTAPASPHPSQPAGYEHTGRTTPPLPPANTGSA